MSYGPIVAFGGSIASGASTVAIPLAGRAYSRVYAQISTMSTAAAMDIYASMDGTSYFQVLERVKTAPVQYQSLTVSTGTTLTMVPLDVVFPFVQFRTSAVVSGGVNISLICVD